MGGWSYKKDPFGQREALKYEHPVPSRELIMNCLSEGGSSLSKQQFNAIFNLQSEFEQEAFRRRLRAMVRDGQLVKLRNGKYRLVTQCELIQGRISGHKDGFGFLAPEDGTSPIFISSREMRKVFDGDLAVVRIINVDFNNRREGQIDKVIEHKLKYVVGPFRIEKGVGFVKPDNKHINRDVIIPPEGQFHAQEGQIVVAEIVLTPVPSRHVMGRVVEILGDHMAAGLEIEVMIRAYGLSHEWSESAQKEAKTILQHASSIDYSSRSDLRHLPFVTIDGEDAKDFDDAVYCEKRKKGGWVLYVAIADVGHYVRPGSALDREAKERGNSVYFPGRVVPMLPPVLSDDLCSLKPGVDRLSLVCEMAINAEGKVTRYRFYSAVIHSHARLTYSQTARVLFDNEERKTKEEEQLSPHLKNLEELYRALHQKRCQQGALSFEAQEIRVEFDDQKKIKKLYPFFRNDAHKIIEECMLCANVCAARFLLKNKCLALYRVHDGPKVDKIHDVKIFLSELGLQLGGGDLPVAADYAKVLDQIVDRPDAHLIQTVLLRSLSQAFYSPDNDGHFGLAFDAYTHFTSPIRRYPDLIVHRVIRSVVEPAEKKLALDYEGLKVLGESCSATERRADEAVRESLTWLKCEYMLNKVGDLFDGVISGVTGFGIFIELQNIYVEGLIHISTLANDYYHFDPVRHRLVGERSGRIYRIGDVLRVRVVRVNLEDKHIDFELISQEKKGEKGKKKERVRKKKNISKRV